MRLLWRRLLHNDFRDQSGDEIIHADENIIVTKWRTPKPKEQFTHGASCYFLKEGYKVSKFFGSDNQFKYYYCDIIDVERKDEPDTYIFTDLLLDVVVDKEGCSKVVDLDEAVLAHKTGIVDTNQLLRALEVLDRLLKKIYDGQFHKLTRHIDGIWDLE